MPCSIAVISARHDSSGEKINHTRPVESLEEAFLLLEQEDYFYNFACIEIRHNEFVYVIDKQNRVYRSSGRNLNVPFVHADRRQGGCRRSGIDRRKVQREGSEANRRREMV